MIRLQLSVLALTLSLPVAAQDTEHDLRLTAKAGTSVWIDRNSNQSQSFDMGGQAMESSTSMRVVASVVVKEANDAGSTVVVLKLERISGNFTMPMLGEQGFDSIDHPPGADEEGDDEGPADTGGFGMPDFDAIGRAASSTVGMEFEAHLAANGKVESIDGVEAAIAKVEKKAGAMGAKMLASQFSAKSIEDLVRSAFGERPDKAIAVGSSWVVDDSDADSGIVNKVTLSLAKASDKAFEITGAGVVTKSEGKAKKEGEEESEEEAMMREMRDQMKIANGKITGRLLISREDGFVVEASTEMSMDLTMPSPMGGDLTIKQTSTVTTKRTTREQAMPAKKAGDADK